MQALGDKVERAVERKGKEGKGKEEGGGEGGEERRGGERKGEERGAEKGAVKGGDIERLWPGERLEVGQVEQCVGKIGDERFAEIVLGYPEKTRTGEMKNGH